VNTGYEDYNWLRPLSYRGAYVFFVGLLSYQQSLL